jgi:FAD/FMN-containing dehydrogenase
VTWSEDRLSWGRVHAGRHLTARPRFADELPGLLAGAGARGLTALAHGLGRSYGDSALNPDGLLIRTEGLDRLIAFDPVTGILRAEAGASLREILQLTVPHGWFFATTPGTLFVTLGGAVANDVHGKNHHSAGSFGCAVRRVGLVRSDRGLIEVSADEEAELFAATIGGLGLTGLIAWVEVALVPIASSLVDQETIPFGGLEGFFDIAAASQDSFEHEVAWIDCTARGRALGRGAFTRANWAPSGGLQAHGRATPLIVPIDAPAAAINPLTLKAFNTAYFAWQSLGAGRSRVLYAKSFYPLDAIRQWNRIYGRRGFYQYQCVTPPDVSRAAVREMLEVISRSGQGSFLVVLKTLGQRRSPGLLSFPAPGATLAIDFANHGQPTLDLMARLDAIVRDAGGRLYPAKDGRMPAAMFQAGYPEWRRFAKSIDPALSSAFWRRVSV